MGFKEDFSHVGNFTGYMGRVVTMLGSSSGEKVLDIPAGNGLLSVALKENGFNVTSADLNQERPDFDYVDMSKPFPYQDNEFDIVVCLEGIEHVLNPTLLAKELIRVCKSGGKIIVSTPNIMNFYSRLQFLFTGSFFQFSPMDITSASEKENKDMGHISPLTYWQLRYLFETYGTALNRIEGDKIKRKVYLPIYLTIALFGIFWTKRVLKPHNNAFFQSKKSDLFKHLYSRYLMYSRSLILEFRKP